MFKLGSHPSLQLQREEGNTELEKGPWWVQLSFETDRGGIFFFF